MVRNITKEKGVTQIVKITLGDKKRKQKKKKVVRKRKSQNESQASGSIPTSFPQTPYIPPIIIPYRSAPLVDSTAQLIQLINPLTQRLTAIDEQMKQMKEEAKAPEVVAVKEPGRPKKPVVKELPSGYGVKTTEADEPAEDDGKNKDLFPDLKKTELKKLAQKISLPKYSKLSKAGLIESLGVDFVSNYFQYRQSQKDSIDDIIKNFLSSSSSASSSSSS